MGLPSSYLHLSAHATLSDPDSLSRNQVRCGSFCWLPTLRRRRLLYYVVTRLHLLHGRCNVHYGLCGSLCTLTLFHSAFFLLFHSANTRYEWETTPYSKGTFTPTDALSFTWRTLNSRTDPTVTEPIEARG